MAVSAGCGGSATSRAYPHVYPVGYEERGIASWYGPGFHGNRTASGERFDKNHLTAAHRTLPMGAIVRVRSLSTGLHVTVRINDRGPFAGGRIIDLSEAAARRLGLIGAGTDDVVLRVIGYEGGSGAAGVLRVQVASFEEHGPAKALADKLKDRYTEVRIVAVDLPGGRRYRVQVGRFSSEAQAFAVAREVNAHFHVESFLVRDDV
ncbi:MAG TPA: septal ring lytic transglycosylase RlpA family protein [Nitrospiraceae bacterium]|nr:septal ring lytic transglycosylase RlpA family protein [Nitrospiraceae bacterium]